MMEQNKGILNLIKPSAEEVKKKELISLLAYLIKEQAKKGALEDRQDAEAV